MLIHKKKVIYLGSPVLCEVTKCHLHKYWKNKAKNGLFSAYLHLSYLKMAKIQYFTHSSLHLRLRIDPSA